MSATPQVLLIGGGGHAAVVAETIMARGWAVAGFLDDNPETQRDAASIGIQRLGAVDELNDLIDQLGPRMIAHAATGNPQLRRLWLRLASQRLLTHAIVHPAAVVSTSARVGEGTFIGPRAVINARAVVGRGVIVNSGAIVEHDSAIDDFAHIAPGSVVAGAAKVGEEALVGCGSVVLPGVAIGRAATIGGGAVAAQDVPEGATVVGVPARPAAVKSGV